MARRDDPAVFAGGLRPGDAVVGRSGRYEGVFGVVTDDHHAADLGRIPARMHTPDGRTVFTTFRHGDLRRLRSTGRARRTGR